MKPRRSLQDMFDRLRGREPLQPKELQAPAPIPKEKRALTTAQRRAEQLSGIQERLSGKSSEILEFALGSFDLTDKELRSPDPPERWVREMGDERRARERFHVARSAQLSKREAPVALELAEKVNTNDARIKAARKGKDVQLNVMVAQMTVPMPEYEVRQVVETESEDATEWLED